VGVQLVYLDLLVHLDLATLVAVGDAFSYTTGQD